jgi:DNA-binding response OmpR family regulator
MKIIKAKFLNSNLKPMEKKTIVIIEDELIIAMDLKRILEQEGFNVIINFKNYNFTETINDIYKYNPSLVILDINLNQKLFDGITIAQHLVVKDTVPFIFITGMSDNEMLDRIKPSRPHGIIIKPFKPIDVTCTVAVVLNNYIYKNIDVLRRDNKIENEVPFKNYYLKQLIVPLLPYKAARVNKLRDLLQQLCTRGFFILNIKTYVLFLYEVL